MYEPRLGWNQQPESPSQAARLAYSAVRSRMLPGNDMRLPVCSPSPSIVKLENLWDWPRAKTGVVELEACSTCYHLSECHVGFEVYKELL
jgi:hypothetical protein